MGTEPNIALDDALICEMCGTPIADGYGAIGLDVHSDCEDVWHFACYVLEDEDETSDPDQVEWAREIFEQYGAG